MKSLIFKSILIALFTLYAVTTWGQDETETKLMKYINTHLSNGNCEKAQSAYDSWKAYTEKTDAAVENRIKSCLYPNPTDSDGDGVPDYLDKCPNTPVPVGVTVDKDGCPLDSDGDGVPDYLDKCPNTPKEAWGTVDQHGCPKDSDGDGVPDYLDKCPNTPVPVGVTVDIDGCPLDSDRDGVPDYLDYCPNTPAGTVVNQKGCPIDQGVVINGVRWATRNVGKTGTFVDKPEDYGKYYTWEEAKNACPKGWRLPALDEFKRLLDKTKVKSEWITQKGVAGRKFTDKATGNSIFLPAAGSRYSYGGTLYNVGSNGGYWSSTQYDSNDDGAYTMGFYSGGAYWGGYGYKSYGFTVRPVAEK